MQKIRKGSLLALAAICFVTIWSGCLKSTATSSSSTDKNAYITVMHLASLSPSLEMYLNGSRVTTSISSNNFFSVYSAVTPANYAVDFKKASSDSIVASISSASYDSSAFYTMLVYRDTTPGIKAVRIKDDFSVLTTDKFYFRFFNMSPQMGPVNFFIDNDKVAVNRWPADNAVYADYNAFLGYNPGYHNLVVKTAGKDSVIASSSTFSFDAGNAYTIFLKGAPGGTGRDALAIDAFKAAK